jgi:uncharacterized protein YndB with AHSA1/START domain
MEARAGGTIELKMQRPDTGENRIIWGRIIEILAGKKLSYTWKTTKHADYAESVVMDAGACRE